MVNLQSNDANFKFKWETPLLRAPCQIYTYNFFTAVNLTIVAMDSVQKKVVKYDNVPPGDGKNSL